MIKSINLPAIKNGSALLSTMRSDATNSDQTVTRKDTIFINSWCQATLTKPVTTFNLFKKRPIIHFGYNLLIYFPMATDTRFCTAARNELENSMISWPLTVPQMGHAQMYNLTIFVLFFLLLYNSKKCWLRVCKWSRIYEGHTTPTSIL